MRPALVSVLLCTAAIAACSRAASDASRARPLEVEPGGRRVGTLQFGGDRRVDFSVELPQDTVVARFVLGCDVPEVELHAQSRDPMDDLSEAPYSADDLEGPPQIVVDRLGSDPVGGATWYVSACWPFEEAPRDGQRRVPAAEVELFVEVHRTRVDGTLRPLEPVRSQLDSPSGGFRTFRIDVPDDARVLRIDLFDVASDFDLYARAGGPVLALDDSVAFAEHNWGHETLLVTPRSSPALEPGAWFVDVVDALGPNRVQPFQIVASFERAVPEVLRGLPRIPTPGAGRPLERALLAVVELATDEGLGSGTILTSDGWILTNAHVTGEEPSVEIVVSLTLDPTQPAEESFRASLQRVDAVRDLALVRIESGLYGQALPAGYEFPTLEIGDPVAMRVGDPLWLVGYPTTGGLGSRVTISATRGILSGYEREDFGLLLKTDAEITQGNSGGAALDQNGLLIGVPSSTVENGSGQIGYVHPITSLPPDWLALLAR